MLGAEKEIVGTYLSQGLARIVFWPLVDLGSGSLNAAAATYCLGKQDPFVFWLAHDRFFQDQAAIFRADTQFYSDVAASYDLDVEQFNSCYTSGEGHAYATERDSLRRELGVINRPTIDINGQRVIGPQPFDVFAQFVESALP